jgi:two-component system, OmpR family, sensor histidine kinase MprB
VSAASRVSLRARLMIGTACTLALAVCAGFVVAYFVVRGQLRGEIDGALKERATSLATFARQAPTLSPPRAPRGRIRITPPRLGGAAGYVQFVERGGKVSLPAGERTRLPITGVRAVAAGRQRAFFRDATVAGTHLRIYTARLNKNTAVEIARPLSEVDHSLARIRLLFLLVSLAAVAGAAAVGLAVARATLRPIQRLTDDAERIAATGNLRERTNERRSDELGRLAGAFNTMLDALTRSVSAQRQLVADASHELRTPLASARANLELVELHESLPAEELRHLVAEAVGELREMTHLIEELVELARGDVQMPPKHPVRLDHLVEEAVAAAARRSAVVFRTEFSPTHVDGAPSALNRAIANLIDNAVKWSPEGAPVEVSVRDGTVTVRDHGPGIDEADLPHVFDRFYRAPAARTLPGSGLGLAIVRQVAEAHGGSATAEPAPGGGSLFALRLPVSTGSLNEKSARPGASDRQPAAKAVPNESSAQPT